MMILQQVNYDDLISQILMVVSMVALVLLFYKNKASVTMTIVVVVKTTGYSL